jgi:hypothetical protein
MSKQGQAGIVLPKGEARDERSKKAKRTEKPRHDKSVEDKLNELKE